jgi:hypothetical protein
MQIMQPHLFNSDFFRAASDLVHRLMRAQVGRDLDNNQRGARIRRGSNAR